MLARAALVLVAVVVIAWLGVMERNLRLTDSGFTATYTLRTKGNIARAERDLRAARLLNPDTPN